MRVSPFITFASLAVFSLGLTAGAAITWTRLGPSVAKNTTASVNLPIWSPTASGALPTLIDAQTRPAVAGWLALSADYPTRVDALRTLLVALPADGFPRLLSGLLPREGKDDRRLLDVALGVWIERFPAEAARWAATNKTQADRAVRAWSGVDPAAAAAWACALADQSQVEELARIALSALAAKDADGALALLETLSPELQAKVLPALLRTLGKSDPAGTVRRFGPGLWKNGEGYDAVQSLLYAWAKTDPRATIAWLLAQPRANDDHLRHWLSNIGGNSRENWEQFAAIVASTADLSNRAGILSEMLSGRKAEQTDRALAFINGLPDAHLRTQILMQMASGYSGNRPDQSLPFAMAMPEGSERTQKLKWLLTAWANHDASAALDWINVHDEPGVNAATASVQANILGTIAKDEPATALAAWADITDAETRKAALQPIAKAWGKTDPAAAVKWLQEQTQALAPGAYNDSTELVFAWRQRDPAAALNWAEQQMLAQQTSGNNGYRYDYMRSLAGDWNQKADRSSTADLYVKIQNEQLRTSTLTFHVRDWLKFDRKAATAWLESHDALSAEQAASLINEASQPSQGNVTFDPFR